MTEGPIFATLALGAVCLFMWWLARLAKKRMGVGAGTVSGNALRVVGKRPLDQKSSLFVIEIAGGRYILVGSGMDGTVTKLDDISAEEYAVMTADEHKAPRAKLRVAGPGSDGNSAEGADDADDSAAATPRFATVGESFSHFLSKAKNARSDRRASGE